MKELQMWLSYQSWLVTLTTQYLIDMLPNCQKQEIQEVGGELAFRANRGDILAQVGIDTYRQNQITALNAYLARRPVEDIDDLPF